jgi:hypothetical protein
MYIIDWMSSHSSFISILERMKNWSQKAKQFCPQTPSSTKTKSLKHYVNNTMIFVSIEFSYHLPHSSLLITSHFLLNSWNSFFSLMHSFWIWLIGDNSILWNILSGDYIFFPNMLPTTGIIHQIGLCESSCHFQTIFLSSLKSSCFETQKWHWIQIVPIESLVSSLSCGSDTYFCFLLFWSSMYNFY